MYMKPTAINTQQPNGTHWLKRLGFAGFAFFFLKGMLWLIIPWLAHSVMF